ncbi:hypothetical protein PHMEG_0006674 [Phytophthora megakarya]|uniref:DUF6818 domain-containing protein n=1 Tax=Phytophthora megakarya TaxID=4795 RepID=A0A225WNC5_9STRA|nr:hypothetical protein PHMEG_0006674 [Phytophthora megakarya]
MRFVNHSYRPVAKFAEADNGRCTTVIVATIKHGQKVTVDYGNDLWFVFCCGLDGCSHQDRQDEEDPSPTSTPMDRNAGTTNYSAVDIDRLLDIVLKVHSLGKNEWERLAVTFNVNHLCGAPERDVDSLRRKFKLLYSTRKPTGVADMPPHIRETKESKKAIDEKANIIELDDEADVNQRTMDMDFSFDAKPGRSFLVTEDLGDVSLASWPTPPTRHPGSIGLLLPRTAPNNGIHLPQTQNRFGTGRLVRSHDELEAEKYPELNSHSNRLGGADLTALRDWVGSKRARGDEDEETQEVSFAKVKRIRAMKATNAPKAKLEGLESAASNNHGSFFEAILLLREENECKAESRRDEEAQRRRDEIAEAEERRPSRNRKSRGARSS